MNWQNKKHLFLLLSAILILLHVFYPSFATNSSRHLLRLDDITFIAPLEHLSIWKYLTEFLPAGKNYALPVRDLSYLFDLGLSQLFGYKTFWLTNVFLFLVTLYFLLKILESQFGKENIWNLFILCIVAFHPISIDILQWVSIRKHLLVGMFAAMGVYKALQLQNEKDLDEKKFLKIYLCYLAGILSFPSGFFWFPWIFFALRKFFRTHRPLIQKYALIFAVTAVAYYYFINRQHSDFGTISERATLTLEWITNHIKDTFLGVGRLTYNALLPTNMNLYYRNTNMLNEIGLVIFAILAGIVLYVFLRAKEKTEEKENFLSFLLLAITLFTPQLALTFVMDDFFVADRYLYLSSPYVIVALRYWFHLAEKQHARWWPKVVVNSKKILVATFLLSGLYLYQDSKEVRRWVNEDELFLTCSKQEKSTLCGWHYTEFSFDSKGCFGLWQNIDLMKEIYADKNQYQSSSLRMELPLYHSFCLSSQTGVSIAEKKKQMELEAGFYKDPGSFLFAENILLLQERKAADILTNLERLKAGNEDPNPPRLRSIKIVNALRGQLNVVCALPAIKQSCEEFQKVFLDATNAFATHEGQIAWGMNASVSAYNGAYSLPLE